MATEYVILKKSGEGWQLIPGVQAGSGPRSVIRKMAKESGEYIAVPARSWNPEKIAIETVVKFG